MKVIKPYYFEHPQYGKMRVLTAGGKTFFCDEVMVTDMVNPQKRGDKLVAKWLLDFIKCRLKDKMYVHCYAADGVYLLSDNSEVDPIDVRFNGRILTINDQIFD